jgi:GTP cyclohydrolase I
VEDVQNHSEERGIPLDQAGVTDLRYPIIVLDREHEEQQTIARLTMSVSLPHHFKGTHMSRFIEVLNEHLGEVTMRTLPSILRDLRKRLEAESAQIEVDFPYFLEREAPASGARGLMDYECSFIGEANGEDEDSCSASKCRSRAYAPAARTSTTTEPTTSEG